jgi:putative hydrolase of the HAD superfamily
MTPLKTILFDWGDTVMRDFPEYSGPMSSWPVVEAIAGIENALSALQPYYTLALATNADQSDEEDIRAALALVGMSDYFSHIFCARHLELTKADPGYYRRIIHALDIQPAEALMVGDSFQYDVIAPIQGGLRSAWYNPRNRTPAGQPPVHDIDFDRMDALPQALQSPLLPSYSACLDMLAERGNPPNLVEHCQAVAGAAYRMAVWLRGAGEPLNPVLAHRGGLLHDLDKIETSQTNAPHGSLSAATLERSGYPALASIATRHVVDSVLDSSSAPHTWEEILVYYADKLFEGSQLIDPRARLSALASRYPAYAGSIRDSLPSLLELERQICERLDLATTELYERLQ